MSDTTTPPTIGQGTTNTPPANTPPANTPPATQSYDWKQHIPTEFKDAPFWAGVKDTGDLVNQFANSQRLIGADKVVLPRADWQPADWDAFYDKVGRPAADKYAFPADEKGQPLFDKEATEFFAKAAHEAGMTQRQLDTFLKHQSEVLKQQETAEKTSIETALGEYRTKLQKEYGAELPSVIDAANRALTAYGDSELTALLTSDPTIANHPSVLKLLTKLGGLMGEDTARQTGVHTQSYSSPAVAMNALKQFEAENGALLFAKDPNTLSFAEQNKRNLLLAERTKLYRVAYPSNQ